MKIVIFEAEQWERKAFDRLAIGHDLNFVDQPLDERVDEKFSDAAIISTFIYSDLHQKALSKFKNLKLIATRSTGFDHIDTGYCAQKGITICNVPSYGEHTVAEHVFGLLLAISHNLVAAIDRTRRGDFSLQGLKGFDLRGKTLGVIGTGSIGQCVIQIAQGFGMDVIAYDVRKNGALAAKMGFRYADLDTLLADAEVITLHVPANPKTHHLISHDEFAKMKTGVVLINTSRGSVVDVVALVKALAEGKVAAAGLDVLPDEPTIREEAELLRSVFQQKHNLDTLLADQILLRLRNVIITPHNAFYTKEAVERILATTVENITAFVHNETQNVVANE